MERGSRDGGGRAARYKRIAQAYYRSRLAARGAAKEEGKPARRLNPVRDRAYRQAAATHQAAMRAQKPHSQPDSEWEKVMTRKEKMFEPTIPPERYVPPGPGQRDPWKEAHHRKQREEALEKRRLLATRRETMSLAEWKQWDYAQLKHAREVAQSRPWRQKVWDTVLALDDGPLPPQTPWVDKMPWEKIRLRLAGRAPTIYSLSLTEDVIGPQQATLVEVYAAAGIGVQNPVLARPPGLTRLLFGEHTGVGIAKVSDAQMETPYGKPVLDNDGNARGYGLGLREPGEAEPDQAVPEIAVLAMVTRIELVTSRCNEVCTSTDVFLAATLAENGPGFTHLNLRDLIDGTKDYEGQTVDPTNPNSVTLHWDQYLETVARGDPKQAQLLRNLIRQFANNVVELANRGYHVPEDLDWDYIYGLTQQ